MTVTDETQTKVTPRLKERYRAEIAPALREQFQYANVMQIPGVTKVVVNMGVGDAARDSKLIDGAVPPRLLVASAKLLTAAPLTGSLNVTVQCSGPLLRGFESARTIEFSVGAVRSTVHVNVAAAPMLPATSFAATWKLWLPAANGPG